MHMYGIVFSGGPQDGQLITAFDTWSEAMRFVISYSKEHPELADQGIALIIIDETGKVVSNEK